ncbi:MAG: DsrE family protein [Planctomycetaceae bacterium]|nr:DsrE family protein [Planctomycetaceae bacterium]
MNRMIIWTVVAALPLVVIVVGARGERSARYPVIEKHGAVVKFPDALEQPRNGSKILVDVTGGGAGDQLSPAIEKLARFVNIYSSAGREPASVEIVAVLHGDATVAALNDAAYGAAMQTDVNPNRALIEELHAAGVRFLVCGQALSHKGFDPQQTLPEVPVAVSGLTAMVNLQSRGFAYIPLK